MRLRRSTALAVFVASLALPGFVRAQPPPIPAGGALDPNTGAVTGTVASSSELAPGVSGGDAAGGPSKEELEETLTQRLEALNQSIDELLSIPQTPAAFAIGTTGEAVARPGTLRDAALQLVALYDANGELKPGFTGEFAPFRILYEDQTIQEWEKNANVASRVLDSVRLSFATAKDPAATAPGASVLVSLGLRLSIIDERDYRRNPEFIAAVKKALSTCFPEQVNPAGGGIDEGPGYTQIDSSEACAGAQRERISARQQEAELREKVRAALKDQRLKDVALSDARTSLSKAKAHEAEEQAVLRTLEGHSTDAAAAKALKPVIDATRAELARASAAVAAGEALLKDAEQAAEQSKGELLAREAEHAGKARALERASTAVRAMNDASDFIQVQHDLEAKYLSQGARLELAFASVLADRGLGDGGAQFRQGRGWLAYEYAFGKGSFGAAGDLTIVDNKHGRVLPNAGETLVDGRLGTRFNFAAGSVDSALAVGLAIQKDQSDAAEYGGTFDLKFTALGALRTGLFARTPFDGSATDLIAMLAISTASGESLYERAYSSQAGVKK